MTGNQFFEVGLELWEFQYKLLEVASLSLLHKMINNVNGCPGNGYIVFVGSPNKSGKMDQLPLNVFCGLFNSISLM